jgi:hypothetical protein
LDVSIPAVGMLVFVIFDDPTLSSEPVVRATIRVR